MLMCLSMASNTLKTFTPRHLGLEVQVYNTPHSHVTRDWQEQAGQLGDLKFNVMDTSGMEPGMRQETIQVRPWRGKLLPKVFLVAHCIQGIPTCVLQVCGNCSQEVCVTLGWPSPAAHHGMFFVFMGV